MAQGMAGLFVVRTLMFISDALQHYDDPELLVTRLLLIKATVQSRAERG